MAFRTWFFGQGALGGVLSAGATAAQVQGCYTIEKTQKFYTDSQGVPVGNVPVFNYVNLAATVDPPPPGFAWGLYSQDTTGQTTDAEILDFANSHAQACANIHGHGLSAFVFPAMDVMWVFDPAQTKQVGAPQAFADDSMIVKAALYSDCAGAQSQGQTGDPAAMAIFAEQTASQLGGIPSSQPYFGGLATNKGGVEYTAQQMADAVTATQDYFAGYWVNVNGEPGKVAQFLNLLDG